jgi:hypothetical protein
MGWRRTGGACVGNARAEHDTRQRTIDSGVGAAGQPSTDSRRLPTDA